MSRLEFGCRAPLHLRHERIGEGRLGVRLLYLSDLHLTRRRTCLVPELQCVAERTRPEAILLGGDLIDRPSGASLLEACVEGMLEIAPVLAVPGNHDHRVGRERVRRSIVRAGGQWLPEGRATIDQLAIDGVLGSPHPGRASVLCTHDPSVFPAAAAAGYDLVLAGHLHGGQCVLWQQGTRLYPGAWFNRWTGLRFREGKTDMIVSRGIADSLPIRWNCPREALLCHL